MNQKDLVQNVSDLTLISDDIIEEVITTSLICIREELAKGNIVRLRNFGTFEAITRKGRIGRNPKTNTPLEIPSRRVPLFRAGKGLRDYVEVNPSSSSPLEKSR